ncbi:hypothetical protein CY34DRAFT_651823 [Suillus luteus UH-Slu-Lm8-n1]|uniref:Uncharacterized protein n=1 Tax=Suillus luteus UH-Slu-Lm8-n1 TaxID=930992 RepID=A0A0D0A7Z4_9AGAM|nr:hypothetical protein CY34DRAFT_651823 [Suillus luteus UH-Slu-Lm8-n1]
MHSSSTPITTHIHISYIALVSLLGSFSPFFLLIWSWGFLTRSFFLSLDWSWRRYNPPLANFAPSSESDTLAFLFHWTVSHFLFSFLGVEDCSITRIASSSYYPHARSIPSIPYFLSFFLTAALIPSFLSSDSLFL